MEYKLKRILEKSLDVFLEKIHSIKFLPINFSIVLENNVARLRNKKVRFSRIQKSKLIKISESGLTRFYSIPLRSFWLYRHGIKNRGKFLHYSYCLNNISFNANDVVIDCGANSGDLYLEISNLIPESNYFAIEPNPSDFSDLKRNYSKAKLINKALGVKNSKLDFYISNKDADSLLSA